MTSPITGAAGRRLRSPLQVLDVGRYAFARAALPFVSSGHSDQRARSKTGLPDLAHVIMASAAAALS
jgi:hypothetical protein